ncbi:MAG: TPM domain-containing protein [Pseudomonadota bacterium]
MLLSETDHAAVTAAVSKAELSTDGEIVTVVAKQSDAYHDVALHWAVLAMLIALALLAWQPWPAEWLHAKFVDSWAETVPPSWYLTVALILAAIKFLGVRLLLAIDSLRMLLTPGKTKGRRVQRKAMQFFRTSAEKRTKAATGVLLYLSLAEHRAEIIADASIHSKVTPDVWGAAMAALLTKVKDGKPGEGMADAVAQIGMVLAEHFPRSEGDTNELPDRLIEL